ncbi:hypothetical protein D046_3961B, partial [Vibrio parahaemolyticus V-223/04]
QTARIRW